MQSGIKRGDLMKMWDVQSIPTRVIPAPVEPVHIGTCTERLHLKLFFPLISFWTHFGGEGVAGGGVERHQEAVCS